MKQGAMLNAYPDSLGLNLSETATFLAIPEVRGAFGSFYILPSVFNTDLDHGFSVISYDLCEQMARPEDLKRLRASGLDLTFDLILNHLSVLSPQFQDVLKQGESSPYHSFFINWNRFWQEGGPIWEDGCIHPGPELFCGLSLHADHLPVMMARLPDGRETPFWCSFYQQTVYPVPTVFDLLEITGGQYETACRLAAHTAGSIVRGNTPDTMDWTGFERWRAETAAWLRAHRHYLGQLDLDIRSPMVWAWYNQVMEQLAGYGASTIRLDAFTRLHKAPGRVNFMNEPETWDILARLRDMAQSHGLEVLPEVHAPYSTMAHRKISQAHAMPYDYFLPGLLLDALDTGDATYLYAWLREQLDWNIRPVNMLGCHDGIPVRDLRGLLPDSRIEDLERRIYARGGLRKVIIGKTTETYQLNTTYFSALGCDEQRLLMARAVQLFMPGIPQIWYEDLFAGCNDTERLRQHPELDEREINRRSYTLAASAAQLKRPVVQKQLEMLRLRAEHPAFAADAGIHASLESDHCLIIERRGNGGFARLTADFCAGEYQITVDQYRGERL